MVRLWDGPEGDGGANRLAGINSTIGHYRGKHDAVNSIGAGAISGMIFKSTRGTRQMLISGGLVATAAGTWAVGILKTSYA